MICWIHVAPSISFSSQVVAACADGVSELILVQQNDMLKFWRWSDGLMKRLWQV